MYNIYTQDYIDKFNEEIETLQKPKNDILKKEYEYYEIEQNKNKIFIDNLCLKYASEYDSIDRSKLESINNYRLYLNDKIDLFYLHQTSNVKIDFKSYFIKRKQYNMDYNIENRRIYEMVEKLNKKYGEMLLEGLKNGIKYSFLSYGFHGNKFDVTIRYWRDVNFVGDE
jgi:hypothetical protein